MTFTLTLERGEEKKGQEDMSKKKPSAEPEGRGTHPCAKRVLLGVFSVSHAAEDHICLLSMFLVCSLRLIQQRTASLLLSMSLVWFSASHAAEDHIRLLSMSLVCSLRLMQQLCTPLNRAWKYAY